MKYGLLRNFFVKYTSERILSSLKKKWITFNYWKSTAYFAYFSCSTAITLRRLWRNDLHNSITQNGYTGILTWNFKWPYSAVNLNRVSISWSHQGLLWSSRSHWRFCGNLGCHLQTTVYEIKSCLSLRTTQASNGSNKVKEKVLLTKASFSSTEIGSVAWTPVKCIKRINLSLNSQNKTPTITRRDFDR